MNTPPDKSKPPLSNYRTIKQTLKNILKYPEHQHVILQTVMSAHRIVIHTLQYLKLYLIHQYNLTATLPEVNEVLLLNIMKVLCEDSIAHEEENIKKRGRPPNSETIALKTILLAFHRDHYKPTMVQGEILT